MMELGVLDLFDVLIGVDILFVCKFDFVFYYVVVVWVGGIVKWFLMVGDILID